MGSDRQNTGDYLCKDSRILSRQGGANLTSTRELRAIRRCLSILTVSERPERIIYSGAIRPVDFSRAGRNYRSVGVGRE